MKRSLEPEVVDLSSKFIHCPIQTSLRILGKKWTILILRDVGFQGIDRFNRLLESVTGITPRMLSIRLKELEREGYLEQVERRRVPIAVRWALTRKGEDTLPIILGLLAFGSKWYPEAVYADGKQRTKLTQIFGPAELKTLERHGLAV
ncbi:MAG: winged helix-turn-helix transcriptional regulator [Nitrososphaerales archaeon]